MKLLRKVIFRLFRILTGRKGIWGNVNGAGNKWARGVIITESSEIGKYNYFGYNSNINNAVIGNYCSIANNVQIGPGDHSKNYITTYQKISKDLVGHSLNTSRVIIGNDVWCGANVVIMQGVKIGDGVIIGSNAVVTRDIPDYAIAVGIPAKVIKYRFTTDIVEIIKASKWFEYDLKEAKLIVNSLEEQCYKIDA